MAFTEKPPILQGSTQDQLRAIRDYLFRMASSLEAAATAPAVGTGATVRRTRADGTAVTETGSAAKADTDAIRKSAAELRALIIKHANELQAEMDTKEEQYNGRFLAQNDFQTWELDLDSRIQTNAQGVVESYGFQESISSTKRDVQDYFTRIDGEIRRGYLEDPDNPGQYVFGIAISSNLQFSGTVQDKDGYTYYELVGNQTFGLYTASGWQFWVNGRKQGYFNSEDNKLHVRNIVADDSLQIGTDWQIKAFLDSQELEFVYVGGGGT